MLFSNAKLKKLATAHPNNQYTSIQIHQYTNTPLNNE